VNLINDPWIPVVTREGRRFRIAPWQLTEGIADDPIVIVAAPRPDFSGALLEFLIGLLQTEAAPEDRQGWAAWKEHPPSAEEIRDHLATAVPNFELFGDGPRFMQSFEPFEGKERPIADLVIDDPPYEMVKRNKDHFIKRGRIRGLCPACVAAALYTANAYSPAAGRGHRTSLRGGGPVTTLMAPDPEREPERATLWYLLWLNVLPRPVFQGLVPGNRDLVSPESTYPWLAPTRTSENGESTTPLDMTPFHVFWGMPRRVRLGDPSELEGVCDICREQDRLYSAFSLRHGGMNYQGAWVHPLTPYSFDESGEPAPFHMPRGGLGYRNWAALVVGQNARKIRREPATVVRATLRDGRRLGGRARLVAFGFDVDNAKIRGWYDYRTPVYRIDSERIQYFRETASDMILAAGEIAGNLRSAIKQAWGTDKSPEFAVAAFWQQTEPAFLDLLDRLVASLGDDEAEVKILHRWYHVLCDAAEELFETWAEADDMGQVDPGKIAKAHLALRRFNRKKAIHDALRLPENTHVRKGEVQ